MVLVHIWSHGPLPPFGRHSLMSVKNAIVEYIDSMNGMDAWMHGYMDICLFNVTRIEYLAID